MSIVATGIVAALAVAAVGAPLVLLLFVTNSKLDVIHKLVNSNMTAALQAERDATVRELAMMQEVIDLKRVAGHEPSPEALEAIVATKSKISELETTLMDRLKSSV